MPIMIVTIFIPTPMPFMVPSPAIMMIVVSARGDRC
jgi:hypothetical protein